MDARERERPRTSGRCRSTRCTSARGGAGRAYDRARRRPGPLPRRPRLHPRRVPAGDGAPVRRLVGLPGHVVLRADRALRRPRRAAATSSTGCTRPASASSSTGCPRTSPRTSFALARFDGTPLYEDPNPSRGEHPDWGTYVFNFGRQRGAQLPGRQRALLARGVPHRRAARRRRRLDALPRLLARGRRVDARTCTAAARTSRRSRSCRR